MKKHYLNALLALGLTAPVQAQLARIVVEGTGGPQVFTDIPRASPEDFKPATQRVYRSRMRASALTLNAERHQSP